MTDSTASPSPLKVVVVMAHDSSGGAARAVFRIFETINREFGDEVDVSIRAIHSTSGHPKVLGGKPHRSRYEYFKYFVVTRFRKYFPREKFVPTLRLLHSRARHYSGLGREINALKPDVVMLGWLGNATLSIEEIGKLTSPVVWRLSDMWMFSGAEHYSQHDRYAHGYSRSSRPAGELGPDINRETFLRKRRSWKSPRHVISPSHWMATQVGRSTLTRNWPVHVIPNPIDTAFWKPLDKAAARKRLGLDVNSLVVLFGAGGGTEFHHKGADLLFDAMRAVPGLLSEPAVSTPLTICVFGQSGETEEINGIPVVYLGELGDKELRDAYSAADIMCVPSRLDNFPSTAVEAQSCGRPVVAFNVGGLPDIVEDEVTGRIVPSFDTVAYAEAIASLLSDEKLRDIMGKNARTRARTLWNPKTVASQYIDVFFSAAGRARANSKGNS